MHSAQWHLPRESIVVFRHSILFNVVIATGAKVPLLDEYDISCDTVSYSHHEQGFKVL